MAYLGNVYVCMFVCGAKYICKYYQPSADPFRHYRSAGIVPGEKQRVFSRDEKQRFSSVLARRNDV